MRRIIKITSLIVLILLVFNMVSTYLLDLNRYKDKIAQFVYEQTSQHLIIKGDIKLSLLPTISLHIKDVYFTPTLDINDAIVSLKDLKVKMQLLPLLRKKFLVHELVFIDPTISLIKDKKGSRNWSFIDKLTKSLVKNNQKDQVIQLDDQKPTPITINQLNIVNGKIIYIDQFAKNKLIINQLEAKTNLQGNDEVLNTNFLFEQDKNIFKTSLSINNLVNFFQGKETKLTGSIQDLNNNNKYAFTSDLIKLEKKVQFNSLITETKDIKLVCNGEINWHHPITEIKFNISSDKINFNMLSNHPKTAKTTNNTNNTNKNINLSILKNFKANINLAVKEIFYDSLIINNLNSNIILDKQLLNLNITHLKLYDGVINGKLSANIKNYNTDIIAKIQDVHLHKALVNNKYDIAGKLSFNFNGSTNLKNYDNLIANLTGTGKFNIKDGQLSNIKDITSKIFLKVTDTLYNKTKFSHIGGSFNINNGILYNKDFMARSELADLQGNGEVNLNKQTINYKIRFDNIINPKIQAEYVQLLLRGNLLSPNISLDLGRILEKQLEKELNKIIDKNLNNKIIKDNIFKELNKLF